jgi:hypothetical protein
VGFVDRRAAAAQHVDLVLVKVDADDIVPQIGKADTSGQAHISRSDHAYLHVFYPSHRCLVRLPRPRRPWAEWGSAGPSPNHTYPPPGLQPCGRRHISLVMDRSWLGRPVNRRGHRLDHRLTAGQDRAGSRVGTPPVVLLTL